jgi:hypothetical protein
MEHADLEQIFGHGSLQISRFTVGGRTHLVFLARRDGAYVDSPELAERMADVLLGWARAEREAREGWKAEG